MPGESPDAGHRPRRERDQRAGARGYRRAAGGDHSTNGSRADVLATLLTIFPTIQASRLRQPDATRLTGLLTMRHFKVGLLTAVPGLMLAGVLAFSPEGGWLLAAAFLAVALQLGCHLWIRQLGDSLTGRALRPAPAPGRAGDDPDRRPRRLRRAALRLVPVADRGRAAARPDRPPVRGGGPARARLADRPAHRRPGRAHRRAGAAVRLPPGAAGLPTRRAGRGGTRARSSRPAGSR